MEGTPRRHWQRFVDADTAEAVGELVAIFRQLRPHVVVTYDPQGGYGHPTTCRPTASRPPRSLRRAQSNSRARRGRCRSSTGPSCSTSAMAAGLSEFRDVPDGWTRVSIDEVPFGYPDDKIDAVVDASEQLPAKLAALRAHATQVTVPRTARAVRCPTTSRCRSRPRSTTSSLPGTAVHATRGVGKPTCWLV